MDPTQAMGMVMSAVIGSTYKLAFSRVPPTQDPDKSCDRQARACECRSEEEHAAM